jgi:hypothetical protein
MINKINTERRRSMNAIPTRISPQAPFSKKETLIINKEEMNFFSIKENTLMGIQYIILLVFAEICRYLIKESSNSGVGIKDFDQYYIKTNSKATYYLKKPFHL